MTVKDLKEQIADLPDDMEVILQKDSEGNGYSPLAGVDPDGIYVADTSWSGQVFDGNWTSDEAGYEEKDWKKLLKKPRSLILFPTN